MIVGAEDAPVPALGLLLLGYPLHAAGKPDQPRVEHFPRIRVPVLFVSGTRDSLASKPALTKAAGTIKGRRTFHWLDAADHGVPAVEEQWAHGQRRARGGGCGLGRVGTDTS